MPSQKGSSNFSVTTTAATAARSMCAHHIHSGTRFAVSDQRENARCTFIGQRSSIRTVSDLALATMTTVLTEQRASECDRRGVASRGSLSE